MNYKEQILADFKERCGYAYNTGFYYRQLEGVLNSLPSEEEIARELWEEYLQLVKDNDTETGSYFSMSFPDWLSTREEE